jgi:hypothetical protein
LLPAEVYPALDEGRDKSSPSQRQHELRIQGQIPTINYPKFAIYIYAKNILSASHPLAVGDSPPGEPANFDFWYIQFILTIYISLYQKSAAFSFL